jgi:hypothetical protein
MKIQHLVDSLDEARRNNFGREVSNAQGQALGRQIAAGAPGAQQAQAQARNAQATNTTDVGGDTLGQTTPAQRLAAQKAAQTASAPVPLPGRTPPASGPTGPAPAEPTPPGAPTGPTGDTTPAPTGPAPTAPTAGASEEEKKSWLDYMNSAQSGADATKFGTGVADATGALNRGAQRFVRGASDLGSTVAQGLGDVASATAGGIGQTIGAAAGGLGAGYHTARQRKSFGSTQGGYGLGGIGDPSRPDPYYAQGGGGGGAGGTTPASTAAGNAEIADLKSSIQKIDQRLAAAKIPESKKR